MSIFIIAEIGINHNGDLDIAKKLIEGAHRFGADAVKFQKRTLDLVYSQELLDSPRESPWGTTQRQQKEGLEFGVAEYKEIDRYCKQLGIEWFASAWDVEAQKFLRQFDGKYNKVASAMLGNFPLLKLIAEEGKHTFISTGMHSLEHIDTVVEIFKAAKCPYELMHCVSTYPMAVADANLKCIETLRARYGCGVGYSGHETGLAVSVGAAAMGITSLERHITLDRAMYGSDQAASVELVGLEKLVKMVRAVETAMGDGVKKVSEAEAKILEKLKPTPAAMGL
ncbi:sialic acid synthase [Paramagnetospirillum caucaseum]|uniref:Sialic acid synthase n=1 Tax=Paramagnetospirillum caucaseum TaxID=1244869 RepID=M2Z4P2_9PROT|nr:N-acetylneuraminate synthase family protein [Paramagnetospirillum caucaseum]EME69330.1 sialic acid synthase [Paramagnetospirillum caucaseum]